MSSPRYEVIESKHWRRDDGKTASMYGSIPWTTDAERPRWAIATAGWTVRNRIDGTVGIGKAPGTKEAAEKTCALLNASYARPVMLCGECKHTEANCACGG